MGTEPEKAILDEGEGERARTASTYSRREIVRRGAGGALALSLGALAGPSVSWAGGRGKPVKIAMVLPGPINDHEFNTVGYSALKATGKALGVKTAYAENVTAADAARLLRDFASKGYNPVIAHSFGFGPQTIQVAKSFPNTTFMDLSPPMAKNVGNYDNPDYQGAYLAGMLAAGTTKTGTIGWVSTLPIPSLNANFHAFEAGAKSVKPSINVLHSFIGTFFDPPQGKEAALAQIQSGADVVSAQTAGVIDACVAMNKFAIGAITDQNSLGPKNVLTSITWNLTPIVMQVAKEVANGTWKPRLIRPGIAGGEIGVASFHGLQKHVDPAVFKQFQAKYAAMKAGKFVVPQNTRKISS